MREILRSRLETLFTYMIISIMLIEILGIVAYSQSISFELKDVSVTNSAGYKKIYPGSRGATVSVYLLYTGDTEISSVSGCLYAVPQIITPRTSCSPARDMNNTVASIVRPGDMIYFTYIIDVSRDAAPSTYGVGLNISYRIPSSGQVMYYLAGFSIEISPYPAPGIYVVDSYLSPISYPGTSNTNIYVVIENDGDSDLVSGDAVIYYPSGFVYQSDRISIASLSRGSRETVIIQGVGLSPSLSPGPYVFRMRINASMSTTDGVNYYLIIDLYPTVYVSQSPSLNIELVRSEWVSAKISIDTIGASYRIVFRNKDLATINSIVARLELPRCMYSSNGSNVAYVDLNRAVSQGEVFEIDFNQITISRDCVFNEYYFANLTLEIYASLKGSEFYTTATYILPMIIPNASIDLKISSVYWGINPVYPGSINNRLVIELLNRDYMDLRDVVATLRSDILYPEENYQAINTLSSGSSAQLVFTESVKPYVSPGVHRATLSLIFTVYSGSTSFLSSKSYTIDLRIYEPQKPLIEILGVDWVYEEAYTHSIGNQLEILLRNHDVVNIRSLQITLRTPENISIRGLREYTIDGGSLSAGSFNRYTFDRIDIDVDKPGMYLFNITFSGYAGDSGSEFWFSISYNTYLEIRDPANRIEIIDYGWDQVTAYENTTRASVYVLVRSFLKQSIYTIVAELELLNALSSQGSSVITSTYTTTINYGDVARIVFRGIEISGQRILRAVLRLHAVVGTQDLRYNISLSREIDLETIRESVLEISYIYSMYQGTSAPILPSARGVTLRIGFVNTKPETVSSISFSVSMPQQIISRGVEGTCLSGSPAGGTCYLDLYLDIDDSARPGIYVINVSTRIYKIVSNSLLSTDQVFSIPIEIEDPSRYVGEPVIAAIYWGTTSPQPVFANSRYVPMTIRITNIGRYPITGLSVNVSSEDLYPIKSSDVCPGTLASGGVCSITLYFDINTTRDKIVAHILMRYMLSQYGAYLEFNRSEERILSIERLNSTENLSGTIQFITSYWLSGSAEPLSMGNQLVILFRNNFEDQIRGAYLVLYLPEGMKYSNDNSSIARVVPLASLPYINPQIPLPQQLQEIYRSAQTPSQVIQRGDFIVFLVPINIFNVSLGIYKARAVLFYTDALGVLKNFEAEISIPVLGSSKYINIFFSGPTIINQSYVDTKMYVENIGSSPIYNVYIAIYPYAGAPLIIASPSVIYLDKIDPSELKELSIRIAYNPYAGYQTEIRYGTTPLMISVIYRDPAGSQRVFNTSYAFVVEPFIRIVARELSAVFTPSEGLKISGTLINMGSATAQRVEVVACVDSTCKSSFIGDVDPASQTAFRIDVPLPRVESDKCTLIIRYYNSYNTLETMNLSINITKIPATQTTTPARELFAELDTYKIIVSVAVISAVIAVLYLLYRYVSRKTPSEVPLQ